MGIEASACAHNRHCITLHLNLDWLNSGLIRKLFMIIVPKFKELEVEVKFIENCLD